MLNDNRKNHFGNVPQKSGPDSKAIRAVEVREFRQRPDFHGS
jgi:hypothetical protein